MIRVIEETFEYEPGLWRYRERLPVEPLVTLDEGGHAAGAGAASCRS